MFDETSAPIACPIEPLCQAKHLRSTLPEPASDKPENGNHMKPSQRFAVIALANGSVTFTGSTVIPVADVNGGAIDAVTLGTNSAVTEAVIDDVKINGATIGHTDDTDLMTLANGMLTVAGEISVTKGPKT